MIQPSQTPFEIIGGAAAVRALVDRFYDMIEQESEFADLRRIHAEDLRNVRTGLSDFMTGWLGGPRDWFGQGKCVMSLHGPIAIDRCLAELWARAMRRAIGERDDLSPEFREQMSQALTRVADAMINRVPA